MGPQGFSPIIFGFEPWISSVLVSKVYPQAGVIVHARPQPLFPENKIRLLYNNIF